MNNNTEPLAKALKEVFPEGKFQVTSNYNGNSFTIDGIDNGSYIYLRIYNYIDTCSVDISNIYIEESMQRKGYFTSLVNKLKTLDFVDSIIASSVLTDNMKNACIKNSFMECPQYSGYIIDKHF